jgi:type IX secretion system substrate protein
MFFLTVLCKAQSFEYIYSSSEDEFVMDAAEDSAGNFYLINLKGIFTGNSDNYSNLLIKLSPSGDSLKTLVMPYTNAFAHLYKIVNIDDSTFVAIGAKRLQSTTNIQIWYLKFDSDLNIVDEKLIGDTAYNHYTMHVRKSLQNELLVSGTAINNNVNNNQLTFYRLSIDGDSLHSFYIGDSLNQFGNDMLQLQDTSGYLLFGSNFKLPFTGNLDGVRINNAGAIDTIVEYNTCQSSLTEITAQWVSDSSFAIMNLGGCYGVGLVLQTKFQIIDLNYDVLYDTIIGDYDTSEYKGYRSMDFIDPDKIFTGCTFNFSNGFFQPVQSWFRINTFNNMQPQWEKFIAHNNDYLFLDCLRATTDGGVLLAGTKYNAASSNGFERDIFVVKLDSLGNFTTGIHNAIATQMHDVIVYPNPAHDVIYINSTVNFTATEFSLFDASGRKVMEKKFNKAGAFSVSQLGAGIYFYTVKDRKGNEVRGKLVKE